MKIEWIAGAILAGIVGYKVYTLPVQAKQHLAPEGTFFVKEYVSFPSDHGMIGVEPGETVHFIAAVDARPGWVQVSGQSGAFLLKADQLTNDIDLADAIRQEDADLQSGMQRNASAQRQQDASAQTLADINDAKSVQQNSVTMSASSAVGGYKTHLHDPATPVGMTYNTYVYSSGGTAPAPAASARASAGGSISSQAGVSAPSGNSGTGTSASQRFTLEPATRLRTQPGTSPGSVTNPSWR